MWLARFRGSPVMLSIAVSSPQLLGAFFGCSGTIVKAVWLRYVTRMLSPARARATILSRLRRNSLAVIVFI